MFNLIFLKMAKGLTNKDEQRFQEILNSTDVTTDSVLEFKNLLLKKGYSANEINRALELSWIEAFEESLKKKA